MVTLRSAFADAGPGLGVVAGVVAVVDCANAPANATRVMAVVRINFFMILFSNFLFLFISSGRLSFSPCLLIQMYGSSQARFVVMKATDRKSTRLNSSHVKISYAVFCLKKKTKNLY